MNFIVSIKLRKAQNTFYIKFKKIDQQLQIYDKIKLKVSSKKWHA